MSSVNATESRSERRRREVIDAARRVVVRNGLQVATLRDIAREAGFTTGVVSHWFVDKREVVVAAFEAASNDWLSEVKRTLTAASTTEESVRAFARLATPDDPGRRQEWRLWSEMWVYAARDSEFAATLMATDALWETLIQGMLGTWQRAGLIRSDVDPVPAGTVLARLIDGLGTRASLSGDWDGARAQLVYQLAALGVPRALLEEEPA